MVARVTDEPVAQVAELSQTTAMDRARFEQIVSQHEREIRRFCTSLVGDAEAGRDLAQDVFLKLWAARDRYQERNQARGMLYVIARNACRSHLRWRSVRKWVAFAERDEPDPAATAHDYLELNERQRAVQRALQKLPEKFRTPVVLRYIEGAEYDTIAEVIGRTPSAARSRVHYGLKKLEDILRRDRAGAAR